MAQQPPPRRAPPPLPTSADPAVRWEKDMTEKFRQMLSTKRMNNLIIASSKRLPSVAALPSDHTSSPQRLSNSQLPPRHGSGSHAPRAALPLDNFPLGAPPPTSSSTTIRNIPLMATPPTEPSHLRFRNELLLLSETPRKWENPGLLDEALKSIPLERIYAEADEETQLLQATAESMRKVPAWAWQDCVIRALLKWFKRSFFTWINNPQCSRCRSPTIASGYGAPTPDERALGANRVELYNCSGCNACERFARYNDAFVLLQTRKGRSGEWVNCFGMLCRAMGSRVRWVWTSEDHVWLEIYSEHRKRWVHVDPCEEAFDRPLSYTEGWNKKVRYCIAFSADGAVDVTRRYCRNPAKYGLDRNKVPEAVLLHIMDEICRMRRTDMDKTEKFKLEGEDMRESRELRHYYVSSLTAEVAKLVPTGQERPLDADAQKAAEGRQAVPTERLRGREQDGRTSPHNRHDHPQR